MPETPQAGKANLYQLRPPGGLPITTVVRASPEWSGGAAGVHFWVLLAYPENPSVIRLDFCLPQDSEHRQLPKRPEVWMETEETVNRNESHRNRSQVRMQLTWYLQDPPEPDVNIRSFRSYCSAAAHAQRNGLVGQTIPRSKQAVRVP